MNGLTSPIKKHRVAEWIKKQNPITCCLKQTHLSFKETHMMKGKGWKRIFHVNGNQKRQGVAILLSDKQTLSPKLQELNFKFNFDFKSKVVREKEGHYIMIKGSIHQEDITIVNIYTPNMRTSKYIKQLSPNMKAEIDSNAIIVKDFSTPLSTMERSSIQKINKTIMD